MVRFEETETSFVGNVISAGNESYMRVCPAQVFDKWIFGFRGETDQPVCALQTI